MEYPIQQHIYSLTNVSNQLFIHYVEISQAGRVELLPPLSTRYQNLLQIFIQILWVRTMSIGFLYWSSLILCCLLHSQILVLPLLNGDSDPGGDGSLVLPCLPALPFPPAIPCPLVLPPLALLSSALPALTLLYPVALESRSLA